MRPLLLEVDGDRYFPSSNNQPANGTLPAPDSNYEEAATVLEELPAGLPALLREESWALPLMAAAASNAAAIIGFEVYIIFRALRSTPSHRHLFLGQCLLLGLLLCALSGLPLALRPSTLSCTVARLAVTVPSALVFGALLVKCVFLVSLNSGVYLPAHYQALLLFFVVLVQAAISVQWIASWPSHILQHSVGGRLTPLCAAPYRHQLLALLYVMLLMLAVSMLAIKCRGYRENYLESAYIGASMGLCLPLWACWTLVGLMLPEHTKPGCLGFGIVLTSAIVFILMFLPKGRQLAAVGKDSLYREDREERLSTTSADRNSPSFFFFKPTKPSKGFSRQSNSFYKSSPSDSSSRDTTLNGDEPSDDAVYSTITRPLPLPPPPHLIPTSNANFYLFRSHSHIGMFY